MNSLVKIILILITLSPSVSYGGGDLDLHAGIRAMETALLLKNGQLSAAYASESGFHVDLRGGMLPVLLGLGMVRQDYHLSKSRHYFDHLMLENRHVRLSYAPSTEIETEMRSFIPIVRLGYTFQGRAQARSQDQVFDPSSSNATTRDDYLEWSMVTSGFDASLGACFTLGNGSALTAEVNGAQLKGDVQSITIRTLDVESKTDSRPLEHVVFKSIGLILGGKYEF